MSDGFPLWVISGVSGAGKATALSALERGGAECVDNLAVDLVDAFAALPRTRPAIAVVDARQHAALERFETPPRVRVLFLDARDEVLIRRLAESTRPHPCAELGRGREAVTAERALLEPLRAAADAVIDTSDLRPKELEQRVAELLDGHAGAAAALMRVTVSSFGFKFGPPLDADWVADVRMLRNPFWVPELRPLTGLDASVRQYVLQDPAARELLDRLAALVEWCAERYAEHGRRFVHVAVGCTGGRHRSVVVAESLAARLGDSGLSVSVRHRDAARPDPR